MGIMNKLLTAVLCGLMVFAIAIPSYVEAATVDMHVEWIYNGSETLDVQGFKLYHLEEDNPLFDKQLVATIEGESTREWDGSIYAVNGINRYTLTAYGVENESPQSPGYRFEYQDVSVSWETEVPGIFILRLK